MQKGRVLKTISYGVIVSSLFTAICIGRANALDAPFLLTDAEVYTNFGYGPNTIITNRSQISNSEAALSTLGGVAIAKAAISKPYVSATSSVVIFPQSYEVFVSSTLFYSLEVDGPTPNVILDVSYKESASVLSGLPGSGEGAATSLYMSFGYDYFFVDTFSINSVRPWDSSVSTDFAHSIAVDNAPILNTNIPIIGPSAIVFSSTQAVTIPTNEEILVRLDAGGSSFFSGSSAAYLDPYFQIDPSNTDPSSYAIELSDGVGNSPISGVPEPGTWALMALGFAGLGLVGSRASRRTAARLA
jgi:hypothetical protein